MLRPVDRFETSPSFGSIQSAAEETRDDPSYAFDNMYRPDGRSGLVVQLTLAGVAYFADQEKRRLVGPHQAMLFSHCEATSYGYPPDAREPYRHKYVEFSDCPVLRAIFGKIRSDFGSIVQLPEGSDARDILSEIVDRFLTGHFADRYQESELLYRLLVAVYRQQVEGTRISDPIEFGHHLILNRFRKVSNIKEIACLCGISREHFTREFTHRYGRSPSEMLKELRLEHADLLLKTTRIPVIDVAAACGFANQTSFTRIYRRQFGRSPGLFRRCTMDGGER